MRIADMRKLLNLTLGCDWKVSFFTPLCSTFFFFRPVLSYQSISWSIFSIDWFVWLIDLYKLYLTCYTHAVTALLRCPIRTLKWEIFSSYQSINTPLKDLLSVRTLLHFLSIKDLFLSILIITLFDVWFDFSSHSFQRSKTTDSKIQDLIFKTKTWSERHDRSSLIKISKYF